MTTPKQLAANRRNARKSTGPRTAKGRAIAKYNALRHGLLAQEVLLPGEDVGVFDQLQQELRAELRPEGELENQLVERIAATLWRLRRAGKVEAGIFSLQRYRVEAERAKTEAERYVEETEDHTDFAPLTFRTIVRTIVDEKKRNNALKRVERANTMQEEELPTLGQTFVEDAQRVNAFNKLSRYEAAIERSFYRALHELQRLQSARTGGSVSAPVVIDITSDGDPSASS